jgi:thiol-disulfide isomerase/thioredoxin
MEMTMARAALLLLVVAVVAPAAEPPPPKSVLHLTNGGFVPGELTGTDEPNSVRWRSPVFVQPLEFPLSAVKSVQYAVPADVPKPAGEYGFELINDDIFYGDLLAVTDGNVEITSPRTGRMVIARDQLHRMFRREGADSIYLGPSGRAGWDGPDGTSQWNEDGGRLFTDKVGATIVGQVRMPEKTVIELELSWAKKPDFVFALGVDERDAAAQSIFRLEVWDGQIVVVGETARAADAAPVMKVGSGEGRIRVQVCLDQRERRLVLLSRGGKPLATLNLGAGQPPFPECVRLTNGKGDVRLDYLRVARWTGVTPRDVKDDLSRIHRADGSVVYGRVAAFDPTTKHFTIRNGGTDSQVPQKEVTDLFLAPATTERKEPTDFPDWGALRIIYRDGSRFSGALKRVGDGHVALECFGVQGTVRLPLAEISSLAPARPGGTSTWTPGKVNSGRLEMDGSNLPGRLAGDDPQPGSGHLVWFADLSRGAARMAKGQAGRIVYRETSQPKQAAPAQGQTQVIRQIVQPNGQVQRIVQIVQPNGVVQMVVQEGPASETRTGVLLPSTGQRSLHLRTGDTIPVEVTGIDEKGLYIKTPQSAATFVAHEKIKCVELTASGTFRVDEAKRDRLLTLPRMQKDSPPTHLICSKNGDFLRGRILEMDDQRLKVEVRLETREVPRDRVAQIIWLHADELTGKPPATAPGEDAGADRVQAIRGNGNRLTFVLEKSDPKVISGKSEILGACQVALAEVDQLLFGSRIEQSAAQLAHHTWRMHYAAEPKFAQEGADSTTEVSGIDSPLVGQPAFVFRTDTLDGPRFNLADHKGRFVVLDFWATWCGPCIQSLPMIEEVVKDFADRDVRLFAVNMEEQPDQIRTVLERHKMKFPVALDRDGAVAARYAVTAIPQTVLVDRDGKIVRLFVGGGKKTADALRAALQELTGMKP